MHPEIDSADSENIEYRDLDFLSYVENLNRSNTSEMLASRVIPSFLHSMHRHFIDVFSEEAYRVWIIDMFIEGFKLSTVRRYSGGLHTLYKEWKQSNKDSLEISFSVPFDEICSDETSPKIAETEKNLQSVDSLVKVKVSSDSPVYVYNKAFQYLLFNPDASIKDVVGLKFSDQLPDSPHLEDIVASMRKAPQAKYVFPLQQGKRREPAIIRDLLAELHNTAKRVGLSFKGNFSRESIHSLWIAAAIKEGISYSEVRSVIRNLPFPYTFLSLIPAAKISDQRREEIINAVAFSITNKAPGWFVLRLRSGVTPDSIKERLDDIESPLRRMIKYYYPLRTIKKVEKKKIITLQTPIIPGFLFFRMPYDRVTSLIAVIGDLAWCYRTSNNPSSSYSVIPQHEMTAFQKCVGEFTSDIEMEIIASLPPLEIGDEVIIEDGSALNGQLATIRKVRSVDGTLTYTLRLSDTAFIRWKDVSLPASHISKVGN